MATTDFDEFTDADFESLPAVTQQPAGQTMVQVRGSYSTAVAVQKPRDLHSVTRALEQESQLAGESFYYGWGAGKDRIEGPSIGLAVAAARCWGNCAIELLPMQDTPTSWVFTAAFVDLETGFTITRQFRQSKKWTVHGKHDAERKDDMRFQIGQSKATRNVILKAVPEWLVDKALAAAKAGVRAKIEAYIKSKGMSAAIDVLVSSLAKVGVTEPHILDKCGVATLQGLTVENLVILKGDLTAIQNGQEFANVLFPSMNEGPQTAAANGTTKGNQTAAALDSKKQSTDIEARIKAELQAAKTPDDARNVYDMQSGPAGWVVEDAHRVRSRELYEVRVAELRGQMFPKDQSATEAGM